MFQPVDPHTIEVPETKPDLNNPRTKLERIERPEWLDEANKANEFQAPAKKAVIETKASIDWNAPEAKKPAGSKGYFNVQDIDE